MRLSSPSATILSTVGLLLSLSGSSPGQDYGAAIEAQAVPSGSAVRRSVQRETPNASGAKPAEEAKKPGGSEGDKEGDKKGEKKEEAAKPKIITRSDKPETPADPSQLEVEPNAEGKVRFNFEGQPWPSVLEWLARVSRLSLDWQELPGDYLNLHTEREYTLEEARDLINRHLLARGFTMLKDGELLTVANISKINVALVPRVRPEELAERMDYEFVKVSFPLEWMLAEHAVEELKPMASPNGKLTALKGINRIEAMDAVVNLREIYRLIQQEQSAEANDTTIIQVFRLKNRRASDVVPHLYDILGLDKSKLASAVGGGGSMSDGMSRQILQQIQQMQQLIQRNQNNQKGGEGGGPPAEPRLIVNDRENSIIAHAPPDKMEIIEQTIKAFDVPGESASALLQNMSRMKVYRLATLDPQPLMQILTELGDLSPQSRIQVDDRNRSLIVYGTLADHYTIQTLVDRLDGSNRSFEVIQLRRVRADAVAGTIKYMFGVEEEDKENNSRSRYYYGYYSYAYGMNSRDQQEDQRPFRVDADIEKNRLLVWANEVELEQVRNLLVKLGELPPGTSNPQTLRAFEFNSDEEAERVLERIRQLWPQMGPNELKVQPGPQRPERATSIPSASLDSPQAEGFQREAARHHVSAPVRLAYASPEGEPEAQAAPGAVAPAPDEAEPLTPQPEGTVSDSSEGHPLAGEADETQAEVAEGNAPNDLEQEYLRRQGRLAPQDAPPIVIQRGSDGRLLFSSPDTAALDRFEELLNDVAPPPRDYRIFHLLPTTWAYGIEYNLEEYFKEAGEEQSFLDWYGYSVTVNDQGPSRMSNRKPLKFISDEDSHTILVSGATPEQMQIIEDLIEIYDQPTASDPQSLRTTQMFQLKHSKAAVVAETVKQVYRDLLSANDPALQNNNGKDQKPAEGPSFTYVYGRGNSGENEQLPPEPIRFKGLLSVGVDEVSNTIVVSAMDGLMPDIADLITRLDEAARPTTTVQVLEINNLDPTLLKERLEGAFGIGAKVTTSQTAGQNPNGNPNQQQMQQQQQGNQYNGGQNQPGFNGR